MLLERGLQSPLPRLHDQLNSPEIEHMVNLENWELSCRLIEINPTKATTKPYVQVPALKGKLNQHQFFAIVLFLLWARNGQNGGFLANGIDLGMLRSSPGETRSQELWPTRLKQDHCQSSPSGFACLSLYWDVLLVCVDCEG